MKILTQANLVNVNLVTNINKSLITLLDTNLKSFVQQFRHGDAIKAWSLESTSSPFTTITLSPLIQPALGILLDSRNATTTSKLNVTLITAILK